MAQFGSDRARYVSLYSRAPPRVVHGRSQLARIAPCCGGAQDARKRVILGGKVIYNEGAYTTDCRIRDLSNDGARVILAPGIVIPTRIVLVDTRNAIAYEAEVMWMRPPDFGLKFLGTYSLRALPAHLQYLKGY